MPMTFRDEGKIFAKKERNSLEESLGLGFAACAEFAGVSGFPESLGFAMVLS